jgi:hypothetical protein
MQPLLTMLYDMVLLTGTVAILRGDENIHVRGVNVALQNEIERANRLQFLQITGNPLDFQVIGPKGRAAILRALSEDLGLAGTQIVPDDDQLEAMLQSMAAAAGGDAPPAGGGSQATPAPSPGAGRPRLQMAGGMMQQPGRAGPPPGGMTTNG